MRQLDAVLTGVGFVASGELLAHVDALDLLPGPVTTWTPDLVLTEPVTYVGLARPDGLPEGSRVLDVGTLNQLVPA